MNTITRRLEGRLFRTGGTRLLLLTVLIGNLIFLTACDTQTMKKKAGNAVEIAVKTGVDIKNEVTGTGQRNQIPEAPSDQKELVKSVQKMLLDKGFDPKGIDGKNGKNTQRALREFQKSRGLPYTGNVVTKEAYNQLAAEQNLTAAQRMRNDSGFVNQSYVEACVAGGVGGAILGYVTGDKKDEDRSKRAMLAGGIGCAAGMGANYWLQGEREKAAIKEEDMQEMLSSLKEDNKKLSGLLSSSKEVVAEDKRKIEQINSDLESKQISKEEAKRQMAEVDGNIAHLNKTLAKLEERKKNWNELGDKVQASPSAPDSKAMTVEIASLEKKITLLKSELGSLEQARQVSAIG